MIKGSTCMRIGLPLIYIEDEGVCSYNPCMKYRDATPMSMNSQQKSQGYMDVGKETYFIFRILDAKIQCLSITPNHDSNSSIEALKLCI